MGTTANLTNAQGEAQVAYRTDPFGEITQQQGESVNRHVFTGQEHDEKTGLIYFGARFYDPDTARFINQDTYLGESTTPPSLHRYLYAYANPTVYIDPDGHQVYKWVDENGQTHFADRPPTTGQQATPHDDEAKGKAAFEDRNARNYGPTPEQQERQACLADKQCDLFAIERAKPTAPLRTVTAESEAGPIRGEYDEAGVADLYADRQRMVRISQILEPGIATLGMVSGGRGTGSTRALSRQGAEVVAETTADVTRTTARTEQRVGREAEAVAGNTVTSSADAALSATKLGNRKLPDKDFPWVKYQRHVTGRSYEEVWQLNQRQVALDARRAGYTVEAKWAGRNNAAWASSPYNPNHRFYDEAEILDQASRQLQLNTATSGKGVRFAVSNEEAQKHFTSLFQKSFPQQMQRGELRVWYVPGTGM